MRPLACSVFIVALITGCGDDNSVGPKSSQTRIVFFSARTTVQPQIYVMNADGSEQTRLTPGSFNNGYPSWSKDGSHIFFDRLWQDASSRSWSGIFRMKSNGSEISCLDSMPDVIQSAPRVSPDGAKIAFTQYGTRTDVWVMNADGSGAVNLTPPPEQGQDPDWSPDGTRIVYARSTDQGSRIYTMKSDGSDTVKVLETGVANSFQVQPRWSPDGTRIVYVDNRGSSAQMTWIYVVHADGSNPTPVTPLTDGLRDKPSWSPDGQRIAYRDAFRDGAVADAEIYTIGVDGSGITNVSRFPAAHDVAPDWGPAR
jgi:TolB protein